MEEIDRELAAIDRKETSMAEKNRTMRVEMKKKQVTEEKKLALTIDKCKREFEYESLHKMGEANEIAQSKHLPISFRALKKENGETVCHIFDNEKFVKEIDLEAF
jgi:septal ring factor EnvC (AmiA/AmiB activator)